MPQPQRGCFLFLANSDAYAANFGNAPLFMIVGAEPGFRTFLATRLAFPAEMTIVGSCAFGYSAGSVPNAPPRKQGTVTLAG